MARDDLQAGERAPGAFLDRIRHGTRPALHARRRDRLVRRHARQSRRVSVHPRCVRLDVSRALVDDAPVRGLRTCRGHQRALPLPAWPGSGRTLDCLRHADADGLRRRPRTRARRSGTRGRVGLDGLRHGDVVRSNSARPGQHLDDGELFGVDPARDVPGGGRAQRNSVGSRRRHDSERHAQGVHRAEGMDLPAASGAPDRHRHDRVLRAQGSALARRVDLGLPHPRGRLDRGAGAGVHDRRRHLLRRRSGQASESRSTISRSGCRSSGICTTIFSKRSPSSAPRAGCGRES